MNSEVNEAFIRGDENALNQVINKYSSGLINYCYSILGNYYDAQDMAQLAFVRLYYKRNSIKNSEALTAYLYRIAYTSSIDLIRKNKRNAELKEKYIENAENCVSYSFDTYASETLISKELFDAMMTLKPADRALVYGIAVEERSYAEMSVMIGKAESVLRKRYQRAKSKLKNYLEQNEVELNS